LKCATGLAAMRGLGAEVCGLASDVRLVVEVLGLAVEVRGLVVEMGGSVGGVCVWGFGDGGVIGFVVQEWELRGAAARLWGHGL
jgi:hypothetical protein